MTGTDVSDVDELAAARLDRLRTSLTTADCDAVALTSPEAVQYATGYRSVAGQIFAGHAMAALVTGDDLWLVCPAADTAAAMDAGIPADRIVPYGRFYFGGDGAAARMSDRNESFGEALSEALKPLLHRRFGAEGPHADVVAPIAGSTVDVSGWMAVVRQVKLPGEQALLREAARIAEQGIEAALAIARDGATERELAAAVATAMVGGGAQPRFVVAVAGERSALGDALPSQRSCRPGDLLRFDVGCVYHGYWSDIARTAVLGEPTARQSAYYEALLAGVLAEFEGARPGTTAGEVFDTAIHTVEAAGLKPYRRHHAGHAIGLSVYEQPIIGSTVDTVLVPGMVFCLETPYYEPGWGGMMVEDTGVVTDSGFELFTDIDRTLRVVPV